MLLVNGSTKTMRDLGCQKNLGHLLSPNAANDPRKFHLPWAADNSAFSCFSRDKFLRMLDSMAWLSPLWVVAPDVVGDAQRTIDLFGVWREEIVGRGFPIAFVAQDGLTMEMLSELWAQIDCLFIGGSTEFKLSCASVEFIREAQNKGKLVHVGRVNSLERIRWAHVAGADSVDGSSMSRFGNTYVRKFLAYINALDLQRDMFCLPR